MEIWATLLEATPEPTAVLRPDGVVVWTNRHWAELASTGDVAAVCAQPGVDWFEAVHRADSGGLTSGVVAVLEGEVASCALPVSGRGGRCYEACAWPWNSTEGRYAVLQLRLHAMPEEVATLRREVAELREAAERDPLTGLYNRRGLAHRLGEEYRQRARTGAPGVAMLIDCDDFKQVNSVLGHAGGDAVLRSIADVLRAELRPRDFAARVGGDEFVVVLPGTDVDQGWRAAQRLRAHLAGAFRAVRGTTVSIGVAELPDAEGVDAVVVATQHALRAAKHGGKDRVADSAHAEAS